MISKYTPIRPQVPLLYCSFKMILTEVNTNPHGGVPQVCLLVFNALNYRYTTHKLVMLTNLAMILYKSI
jgi:hypothetical protein